MSTAASPVVAAYTPTVVDGDQLVACTVGRARLIRLLVDRVRVAAATGNRCHTLLVGPRGSGKTHLLTVTAHLVRSDPDLQGRVMVATVAEDAFGITSYEDLLVAVVDATAPDRSDDARGARRLRDRRALESTVLDVLAGRLLLLVVENLDRVFADLGDDGQHALRAFVEGKRCALVLASTPLLFDGVSQQSKAWFGSFGAEPVDELSPEQGAELLGRLAGLAGDHALVDYLASPVGLARVRAVAHLAGGSARLWVLLAGVAQVDLLDALVPLVIRLLDELVPYYQERLRELPAQERKVVIELSRLGGGGLVTATDLAAAAGITTSTATSLLGRLEERRLVRKVRDPTGDRRRAYYELREPLLRHCLGFRETGSDLTTLLVGFLRSWYQPFELSAHLLRSPAHSAAERLTAQALDQVQPLRGSDDLYEGGSAVALLERSRRRRTADPADLVALVCEAAATAATMPGSEPSALSTVRARHPAVTSAVQAVLGSSAHDDRARIADGLDAAAARSDLEVDASLGLGLAAVGWRGAIGQYDLALDGLRRLQAAHPSEVGAHTRLDLAIQAEMAYFTAETGDVDAGLRAASDVMRRRAAVFGDDDPDTLTSAANVAHLTGLAGDHTTARDLYATLIDDRTRILGPDHPDTLISRSNHAHQTGAAGDHTTARDLHAALVDVFTATLGPDHPHTLTTRHCYAYETGLVGDHAAARNLYIAVIEDRTRTIGPDHPDTLVSRSNHAAETGLAGDHAVASNLYSALIDDRTRILGPHHPVVATTRAAHVWLRRRAALDDRPAGGTPTPTQLAVAAARRVRRDGRPIDAYLGLLGDARSAGVDVADVFIGEALVEALIEAAAPSSAALLADRVDFSLEASQLLHQLPDHGGALACRWMHEASRAPEPQWDELVGRVTEVVGDPAAGMALLRTAPISGDPQRWLAHWAAASALALVRPLCAAGLHHLQTGSNTELLALPVEQRRIVVEALRLTDVPL